MIQKPVDSESDKPPPPEAPVWEAPKCKPNRCAVWPPLNVKKKKPLEICMIEQLVIDREIPLTTDPRFPPKRKKPVKKAT